MIDRMKARLGWHNVRQRKDRNGQWEARYSDESGKVKGKLFLTKSQAQKYAWDAANGTLNAAVGLTVPKKSLEEARDSFLARSLDPKTTALNERRVNEFLDALPDIATTLRRAKFQYTGQITDEVINEFDKILVLKGCNPGGRHHVLKIVRAFCKYCMDKKWIGDYPFKGFKMPKSQFEGRLVTREEFALLCSRGWSGGNQHSESEWGGGSNQYGDVDVWLHRALRFGRETMLRISQVWELSPVHFRAPDQLYIRGIKGQDGVWITLRPAAADILREIQNDLKPGERYFNYWSTVESMRASVHDKAIRVGLKGIRFHDACKVSRVSELDAMGTGLGKISELSNTSKKTLSAHYIKADRNRAFEEYATMNLDRAWTERGPKVGANSTQSGQSTPMDATNANSQINAISPQNPNL